MANSDDRWRFFFAPSFGIGVKAKTKAQTHHNELATSFNTLQQHVAQYLLQYSHAPGIFQQVWFWLLYEEWTVQEWLCDDIVT